MPQTPVKSKRAAAHDFRRVPFLSAKEVDFEGFSVGCSETSGLDNLDALSNLDKNLDKIFLLIFLFLLLAPGFSPPSKLLYTQLPPGLQRQVALQGPKSRPGFLSHSKCPDATGWSIQGKGALGTSGPLDKSSPMAQCSPYQPP